ncbi:MAG: dephospho-CoA kinase [Candidatus Sericytochromatia bacterium]|nr:dephospho-CoA kinase [Candidatus Sericytochromatia bacterium]
MRLIGLTGGIACGKTAVADVLAGLGAAIIDTDALAREVVAPGSEGLAAVVAAFGPGVLREDGALDREKLGALVFTNPEARETLNGITHPRIRGLLTARVAELRASARPPRAAVLVVPLLFENGLDRLVDEAWVVDVPEGTQRERLAGRNAYGPAEVEARISSQMPRAERLARASRVIDNAGPLAELGARVAEAWQSAGLTAEGAP